ncbi:MAG: ABC transporter permease [Patescibacteria group bacterium]|nr:ABC transporter permease [Patescibacteria group bacterium]MDD4611123.1 ABC transporter permease [Patescibacteria group bacterium]
MFLLSSGRIIKFSFQDIFRNIWLSIVTVIILALALFSINMLLVVRVISQASVEAVKDKIDISVFVKADASEEKIINLKKQLENLSGVEKVDYISKAQALEAFRQKYQNDPNIIQALQELGNNPLTPTLIVKPADTSNFDVLINDLNKINDDIIESKDFTDHKLILERINSITNKVSDAGMILSLIFVFISVLVIYNAVRVAIYTHRKEIAIMRLVGASASFIYMPFLLSGLIYALVGVLAIVALFYPFLSLLQPYLEAFFIEYQINIIQYYNSHFLSIFGLQLAGAAMVNIVASYIAVKKYAKV